MTSCFRQSGVREQITALGNSWNRRKECPVCGRTYWDETLHAQQKTCGPKCKKAWQKMRDAAREKRRMLKVDETKNEVEQKVTETKAADGIEQKVADAQALLAPEAEVVKPKGPAGRRHNAAFKAARKAQRAARRITRRRG